jgi:hypothetical protein
MEGDIKFLQVVCGAVLQISPRNFPRCIDDIVMLKFTFHLHIVLSGEVV